MKTEEKLKIPATIGNEVGILYSAYYPSTIVFEVKDKDQIVFIEEWLNVEDDIDYHIGFYITFEKLREYLEAPSEKAITHMHLIESAMNNEYFAYERKAGDENIQNARKIKLDDIDPSWLPKRTSITTHENMKKLSDPAELDLIHNHISLKNNHD